MDGCSFLSWLHLFESLSLSILWIFFFYLKAQYVTFKWISWHEMECMCAFFC